MKILVVLPRFPYPLDKGDKLRAYHQIVELAKHHEVYLFALTHSSVPADCYNHIRQMCHDVKVGRLQWWESAFGIMRSFFSGLPLQLGYWTSHRVSRAYLGWENQIQPDVVYCQMVRSIPTVSGSQRRKVLDYQDALSLNTHRHMEHSHGLWRLLLKYEYKALLRTEQKALQLFNATTIIAPADRDAISSSVHLVPNGVDTEYFNTAHCPPPTTHYTIVFTGNMSYAPNVDAACWLVKEIMPLVWKQQPYGINVFIAGADPKPAVKALAGPRVTVSGRLPDIRSSYNSAKIFVAPMRIGSGMQNKLLEAMSMQLPCVTTSLASSPLGATAGEHLLVGDTAEQLADWIIKLTIEELHNAIAESGHRFVVEHYSWSSSVAMLEEILTGNADERK